MKSRSKKRDKKNKRQTTQVGAVHTQSGTSVLPLQTTTPVGRRLSLCMIVKDEAKHLGTCLKSIQSVVDEIIVVDTGSTDTTPTIAKSYGAKIINFPWINDFSAARNESIKHATGDYIMWLDADDILEDIDINRLKKLKAQLSLKKDQAYYIVVSSEDRQIGATEFNQCRIFPNIKSALFEYPIHEQITGNLEKAGIQLNTTDIIVRHIGNVDRDELTRKTKRNIAIIEDVLKKDPHNMVMNFHAARSWANLEEQEKAIEFMQKVIDDPEVKHNKGPLYLEAGLLMGRYYNDLGLTSSAESILKELKSDYPEITLIDFEIGKSYYLAERYSEAITVLEATLKQNINPGFMPINTNLISFQQYYFLGKSYDETNGLDKAIEMYKKSLDFHQWDFKSYHALGLLYLKKGVYQEALDFILKAGESAPEEDCVLQSNLGLIYRKLKDYPAAEKALMRAIEINPDRVEAFSNLGYLYMEMANYEKAASSFVRVLRLEPEFWDIRFSLCETYFRTAQVDKLVESCSELLNLLNLTINQTLEGLEDLALIFETIGDSFAYTNKRELAIMAYQTGFIIYPVTTLLHKLLPLSSESKRQQAVMNTIKETLSRYEDDAQIITSIQSVLDQFKHAAQYAYK